MTSNRISRMNMSNNTAIMDSLTDTREQRVRNPSCSASSTVSSSSLSSSSALSNLNENYLIDVLVLFPNGFQISKKLDSRKAIYDILIELSSTAKLIPTNYTLKLFCLKDENTNRLDNDSDLYKLVEYTPNQTIGQLNPARIIILPKTTTLKHQQLNFGADKSYRSSSNISSVSSSNINNNKSSTLKQAPFELTTRVEVNLPFNQKSAVRVKPDIILEDLFASICKEACVDRSRYDFIIESSFVCKESLQDSFASFNTKEVTLVLKRHLVDDKSPFSKLNSKSTHSLFTQNILKNRTQSKHYQNQKLSNNSNLSNQSPENTKLRSKSELDLSLVGKENSNTEKNFQDFKSSTTNLSKQKSTSNMFSFFTRKNKSKSKSKSSLNIGENQETNTLQSNKSSTIKKNDDTNSIRTISSNQSEQQQQASFTHRFKKRQAPAPPQVDQTLKSVKEVVEIPKKNRPKSELIERSTLLDELDKESLEKIINLTKKKKKAAPPPPPQELSSTQTKNENESLNVITDKKESTPTSANSSPKSFPSPSLSELSSSSNNQSNSISSNSDTNNLRYENSTIKMINNSLIIPANVSTRNETLTENKKEIIRQPSIHSNSSEIEESMAIALNNSSNSNGSFRTENEKCRNHHDSESANECSITSSISNSSFIANVDNLTKSFANTVNLSNKIDEQIESRHNDSLILSNVNCVKSFYGAVTDQNNMYSEDDFSDFSSLTNTPNILNENNNHIERNLPNTKTKIILNKNFTNASFDLINNDHLELSPSLRLDTRIPNVLVEASESHYSYKSEDISIQEITQIEQNKTKNDQTQLHQYNEKDDTLNSIEINIKPLIKQTAKVEVKPEFVTSVLISNDNEEKVGHLKPELIKRRFTTIPATLKSPSSPPPQFPAIGENEMNELHQNYTVVRSGDIIEKNGIYYSTDGTIRGYSGIVKKLANSKALNEVFVRQQELEQQHERDYELELKQRENAARLNITNPSPINTNPNLINKHKQRISLGNIVANEKRASNSNLYGIGTLKSAKVCNLPEMLSQQSIGDELSQKLENRRQTIASQLLSNTNLEIDISVKSIVNSSNSSSIQSTSPSVNDSSSSYSSPQTQQNQSNLYSNQLLKNNQKVSSPNFVMSAKVRSNPTANFNFSNVSIRATNQESVYQNRNSLISELKSLIPMHDLDDISSSVPPAPLMTELCVTPQKTPNRPMVAPKNFNQNTIQSLNKKNQIINARDDLLHSIKGFSVEKLKRVDKESI